LNIKIFRDVTLLQASNSRLSGRSWCVRIVGNTVSHPTLGSSAALLSKRRMSEDESLCIVDNRALKFGRPKLRWLDECAGRF
jgi:hypothetical protein